MEQGRFVVCSLFQLLPTCQTSSHNQFLGTPGLQHFYGRDSGERGTKSIGHSMSTKIANFYNMDRGLKKKVKQHTRMGQGKNEDKH